jgi:hypothetical protein
MNSKRKRPPAGAAPRKAQKGNNSGSNYKVRSLDRRVSQFPTQPNSYAISLH